jgi:hypothetical protein
LFSFQLHLSFFVVGHTHEDIDAGVSHIADKLRNNNAETVPKLLESLPDSRRVHGLYDIKNWLAPHINTIFHYRPCTINQLSEEQL